MALSLLTEKVRKIQEHCKDILNQPSFSIRTVRKLNGRQSLQLKQFFQHHFSTLRWLINRWVKINRRGGQRFFLNLINGGEGWGRGGIGISKNLLISVMNGKRDINV